MKSIDEILAACIEDVETGRSTIEQCLERYETVRAQLEPLLRMAVNIQPPAPVKPTREFTARARVNLMEYIHNERGARKSWKSVFAFLQPPLRTGWVRVAAIVISAVLVLTASGAGTAYAAQDSLPGEMLYPVKTFTEDFRVWLETDKEAEVALELEFAEKRLDEMEKLVDKAPENLSLALSGYERNLDIAFEKIGQFTERNRYCEQLAQFSLAMANHISIIDKIEDNSGGYETVLFQQTRELAMNRYSFAICSMSEIDGVRATEMNLQLMQNRLQRAYNAASRGEKGKAEEALGQYIQLNALGEQILQIAGNSGQDTSEIVVMNSEAAQNHQHQLGRIDGDISGSLKSEAYSITEKMAQNQGEGMPDDNSMPIDGITEPDNQINQPEDKPTGNQPQASGNPQQGPDNQQQPDGQSGTGNGSGSK